MKTPEKFLIYFLICNLFCLVGFLLMYNYQIGARVKSEYWLKDVFSVKDFISEKYSSNKIIVIGGSSSLFGIDSQVFEQISKTPVLNYGMHGSQVIDNLYYRLKKVMKMGDTVVMPLEFEYYGRDNDYSEWFVNNVLAWDVDYYNSLNFWDKIAFIMHTSASRVFTGFISACYTADDNKIGELQENEVVSTVKLQWPQKTFNWHGYSFKNINEYGDMLIKKEPEDWLIELAQNGYTYLGEDIIVTGQFVESIKKIENYVQSKSGRLFLTWPVTIRNKSFDLGEKVSQTKMIRLAKKLTDNGLSIYCNPALFQFDVRYFFNSVYHLNRDGAFIRSINLANCINDIENNQFNEYEDFHSAIDFVRKQENATDLLPGIH